jgi:GTPase SAR1 family protein
MDETTDSEYTQCYRKYEQLCDNVSSKRDLNEAQTRLEIIDTILFDCLAWSKHKNIYVEERTEVGFADYIIRTSRDVAVVEAKRQSIYFNMPISLKPVVSSIKSLTKGNDELHDAIKQALGYAQSRGLPIAIVTNGTQYIAFIASRSDGQAPLDGQAIAFTSLEQIRDYYVDFWNYFSKNGMLEGNLSRTLLKGATPQIPPKASSFITDYPGTSTRNSLQNDLMLLSEMVLEDLIHEDELEKRFLKYCYCQTGALSQYAILARDIIKNRYEQLDDSTGVKIQRIATKKGISKEFLEASLLRRPIILIGDVGVGKTTFIRNLILSDDGILGHNDIAVHVNLGENAILSADVKTGALTTIKEILFNDYGIDIYKDTFVRGVYQEELKRLKTGIYKSLSPDAFVLKEVETLEGFIKNDSEHIKRSIDHIETSTTYKQSSKVVIFLDNADQRNSKDQQEIFLVAHELSTQTRAAVFVSIRPETFYLSYKEGVLKAYHPKVFTIEPPRIDLVLQKRIEFALMIAKGEIAAPVLVDQTIKLSNMTAMLEVMLRTLKSDRREQKRLMAMIDNIASGNVRSAVDMVKNFLSSAHTNTKKILEIEERTPGEYLIPVHEFMRSLIYGDKRYFDPSTSLISNIFEITTQDPKEYFLNIALINELIHLGRSDVAKQGFVGTSILYTHFQALGYLPEQIEHAIEHCLEEELVENPINSTLKDSDLAANSLRVTARGGVYINMLTGTFVYIDAMLVDTPIMDENLFEAVNRSYEQDEITIDQRLERVEAFVEYLKLIYNDEIEGLNDTNINQLLPALIREMQNSLTQVRASLVRTAIKTESR